MTAATLKKKNRKPRLINQVFQKNKTTPVIKPAVNINEAIAEYIIYVAVPGMERKDFSVTINSKMLTVSARKGEALHCFSVIDEFPVLAEWKESFKLPEDADTLMTAAVYKNGELEIHIPRGNPGEAGKPVQVFVY